MGDVLEGDRGGFCLKKNKTLYFALPFLFWYAMKQQRTRQGLAGLPFPAD